MKERNRKYYWHFIVIWCHPGMQGRMSVLNSQGNPNSKKHLFPSSTKKYAQIWNISGQHKKSSRWMFQSGQAKSSPALEGIEKCNKCSYKSSLWKHLKDRINIPHLRKTFQCDQCDQALTKKNCLRPHIQFVHEHFGSSATNALSRGTLMDI